MTRRLCTMILAALACTLFGCAQRTPVRVTAYDTTTGQPVEGVEFTVGYSWMFPEFGPSASTHVTDEDGVSITGIAKFRAVNLYTTRPGYELGYFKLSHF